MNMNMMMYMRPTVTCLSAATARLVFNSPAGGNFFFLLNRKGKRNRPWID